ncbi:Cyclic AMP-responsive element-binding protein 1 [Schistosoma haematobium]|uniref:Cyclic AMP-responsive element-binding protein 1 n=1 Tax=Schistosoma haematobium TaxID=6185 RepID=A0A922IMI1_SCHHA|nr:Cyclic AMP-responsive element-binding protein 1 [Schistosoma haematobium]KAH9582471.1 Cyclic AMP-responsive element-binding protein 1 [Schistosoma haematobium]
MDLKCVNNQRSLLRPFMGVLNYCLPEKDSITISDDKLINVIKRELARLINDLMTSYPFESKRVSRITLAYFEDIKGPNSGCFNDVTQTYVNKSGTYTIKKKPSCHKFQCSKNIGVQVIFNEKAFQCPVGGGPLHMEQQLGSGNALIDIQCPKCTSLCKQSTLLYYPECFSLTCESTSISISFLKDKCFEQRYRLDESYLLDINSEGPDENVDNSRNSSSVPHRGYEDPNFQPFQKASPEYVSHLVHSLGVHPPFDRNFNKCNTRYFSRTHTLVSNELALATCPPNSPLSCSQLSNSTTPQSNNSPLNVQCG